jgi:hypothetical protein
MLLTSYVNLWGLASPIANCICKKVLKQLLEVDRSNAHARKRSPGNRSVVLLDHGLEASQRFVETMISFNFLCDVALGS